MSNPYSHPALQRDDTMYLSTLSNHDNPARSPYYRESSFLAKDIPGTAPKVHIPLNSTTQHFMLSTFVEPIPDRSKHIQKTSNPLYIDDIEGTRPKCTDFRSTRVVNPLCPKYLLPSASETVLDPGRKFIRDTLDTRDINKKHSQSWMNRGKAIVKDAIEGSAPAKLTRDLKGVARLEVRDINKDMLFETNRHTNPLQPSYLWRDQDDKSLNDQYGGIMGSEARRAHPHSVNKPNNLCLGIKDIEGSQANSFNTRSHFMDKRRQFRDYMVTQDIEKAQVSTLKKGISSKRQTNPLMPNYQFPGAKEVAK